MSQRRPKKTAFIVLQLFIISGCGWTPEGEAPDRRRFTRISDKPTAPQASEASTAGRVQMTSDSSSASPAFPDATLAEILSQLDRVRREMREKDEYLAGRIDAEAKARREADEALSQRVTALDSRLTGFTTTVETKLEAMKDREGLLLQLITAKLEKLETSLQAEIDVVRLSQTDLEERFAAEKENARGRRQQTAKDLAALAAATESKLQEQKQLLAAQVALLDQKLSAEDSLLAQRIDGTIAVLEERQQTLATRLSAAIEAGDAEQRLSLQAAKTELAVRLAEMKGEFEASVAALGSRLDQTAATLRESLAETETELRAAITSGHDALANQLTEQKASLEASLEALAQQTKTDKQSLVAAIESTRAHLAANIESVEDALLIAVEEGNNETRQQLAAVKEALEERLDNLDAATATNARAIDLNKASIAALQDKLDATKAALVTQLAATKEALASAIEAGDRLVEEKLKGAVAVLTLQVDAVDKAAKEDALALRLSITQGRNALEQQIASTKEALTLALQTSNEQTAQKIAALNSDLLARLAQLGIRLDTAIDDVKKQLQSAVTALRNELKEVSKDLTHALEIGDVRLQAELSATRNALEQQIALATKALHDAVDSNSEEIRKNRQELTSQLAETEERLNASLQLAEGKLQSQLTDLSSKLAMTDEQLRQQLGINTAEIADTRRQLTQLAADVMTQIKGAVAEMSGQNRELALKLVADLQALEGKLTRDQNELRLALLAEINLKSEKIEARIIALQEYANTNFATKGELQLVQHHAITLNMITASLLNKRIDDLHDSLSSEIKAASAAFSQRVGQLEAKVEDLEGDFSKHVDEYKVTTSTLSKSVDDKINAVQGVIAAHVTANEAARLASEEAFANLESSLANLEFASLNMRTDLEAALAKVNDLEEADRGLDADIKAARDAAQAALDLAIAQEQEARAGLELRISELASELERAANVADKALALAENNEKSINGLHEELSKAKEDIAGVKEALEDLQTQVTDGLEDIKRYAEGLVADLGSSTKFQLAKVATALAEAENRDDALRRDLGRLANRINEKIDPTRFNDEVHTPLNDLVLASNELKAVFGITEEEFINTIDTVHNTVVDNRPLFEDFVATIGAVEDCKAAFSEGYSSGRLEAPAIGGIEWYKIVARYYVFSAAAGTRSGDSAVDKIFFETTPFLDGTSLASSLFLAASPSLGEHVGGECLSAVKAWARHLLTRTDAPAFQNFRDALAKSKQLKIAITELIPKVFEHLATYAQTYEAKVEALLKELGLDGLVASTLDELRPATANIVRERSVLIVMITASRKNIERIAALAKTVAENQARLDGHDTRLTDFESQFSDFMNKINTFVTEYTKRTERLESSLSTAFSMIAGIAARLGYSELVEAATIEISKLGGTVTKNYQWPVTCEATSRFYNFGTVGEGSTLRRCDSSITDSDGRLIGDDGQSCRAREHYHTSTNVNTNTHENTVNTTTNHITTTITHTNTLNTVNTYNQRYATLYLQPQYVRVARNDWRRYQLNRNLGNVAIGTADRSYWSTSQHWSHAVSESSSTETWVNEHIERTVSTSFSSTTEKTIDGAYVGDLTIPLLAADDPKAREILARPVGSPIPEDLLTMIGLRVFGNGYFIKIADIKNADRVAILLAKDFEVSDTSGGGLLYEVPVAFFLAANPERKISFSDEIKITMLGPDGVTEMGESCFHKSNSAPALYTYSNTTSQSTTSSRENRHVYQQSYAYANRTDYRTSTTYRRLADYWEFAGHYSVFYISPIVLDLKNTGEVKTIAPREANVAFDIDGDGDRDKIGWLDKAYGFLALDLNDNDTIDGGHELFGNHTLIGAQQKAENGYAALAQYDLDNNGRIDSKDPIFPKLKIWIDKNLDGISQPDELQTLTQHSIEAIGVTYQDTKPSERVQHPEAISSNLVPYEGRFWGPKQCSAEGCKTYDVYFGRDNDLWLVDQ